MRDLRQKWRRSPGRQLRKPAAAVLPLSREEGRGTLVDEQAAGLYRLQDEGLRNHTGPISVFGFAADESFTDIDAAGFVFWV